MRGKNVLLNMITNATGLNEVTPNSNLQVLGETILETIGEVTEKTEFLMLRQVARSRVIGYSPRQRIKTVINRLNDISVTVIDSDTIKGSQKFNELHVSAFGVVAHGDDNKSRVVREAPYRVSGMSNMNQRGRTGVHTSNLDKGLHYSERFLCSCGTTFPLNSIICRSCGSMLDEDVHEVVLRESTRNHTRHAQHIILALDGYGRPYFSIGRVEFQKGKQRTKAGQAYRGTQWTDCKQMTFFVEGAKVEQYIGNNFNESGIYCTPVKVFVTRDYFNYRSQGGEQ
tara:strand:- start:574 stop:1425 length:852 start_codon:yes stop_codon:yes gene_type:complete